MKNESQLNKGFTLIELMITLVLSLMITYGIAQVLIISTRTSVSSEGMSQSQETGRFIMTYLAHHIREAGINSESSKGRNTGAFISCTDYPDLINDSACIEENDGGENQETIITEGIHGDRLAIARIAHPDKLTDCSGSSGYRPLDAPAATPFTPYAVDDFILNTFWVEFDDATNLNSLMCQGFLFNGSDVVGSSPQQAIAAGVEAMQLLYGEANLPLPPSEFRNVSRYVPASNTPEALTENDVQNWNLVYAVKVSIMTRSLTDTVVNNTLRSYVLANAAPYDMTDAISRQVFTTTFVINNYW